MGTLTTLVLTNTRVAEFRALEYMAIGALSSLLAVSVCSERPAHRVCRRVLRMHIRARSVVTIALGEMHAEGGTLLCNVM